MAHDSALLQLSRQAVRRICRRSGSNFTRSFLMLPAPKREAMEALYAFARVTDDLGDGPHPISVRSRWLDWWRQTAALNLLDSQELVFPDRLSISPSDEGDDPVRHLRKHAREILPALAASARQFEIPSRYLLEIIDGVSADQQKTRFDTYEQVEHYCYLVASAVGLACLYVWGFDELPETAAIDCGLGFQWTNILRDIREDAGRGRIYLPRQHYEKHGLAEDDLLRPRVDDRLTCLIEEQCSRAADLYDSGWGVFEQLHPDGQRMFSMMWRTYRRLLSMVEADPSAVLRGRIGLTQGQKFQLAFTHTIPLLFRRLPVPPVEVKAS
ncbi:MAG: phytoene/squalene synthase family protein [Planctomycetota bacterium]